ncbi:MAG TPA: Gfo/Idh/MocA family oxidoreductase [Bryobacteraceae bacterium]|nr:Gfo/Idh/MocA family oxidoreductase [Bryobacteraceae bacterium]
MNASRREFLASGAAGLAPALAGQERKASANDRIRIATIGIGGMGTGDTTTEVGLGAELVGVCDIYDGRLERAKEVWGKHIFTTRDYREILARKDVDAVIIATPDHWHAKISIEALDAGKHVFCQKPMVQLVSEGKSVIDAQKRSGKVFQVGSQYVSSLVYIKARDLVKSGAIGKLNMVEAWLDRNTAMGAWQYTIPPDATPENVDWDRFLGRAPKRPFEPIRLFRWRNYNDYGTGLAGDLFVHLLSGLHLVTGSMGPERIMATGGLRYWKDGRDVPDVMLAMLDYPATQQHPEFTLALRVNFKSGVSQEQFGFRFVGSQGIMTTSMSGIVLDNSSDETEPGFGVGTFPKALQERIIREYRSKYPARTPSAETMVPDRRNTYDTPPGHNAHREHHRAFLDSIRKGKPSIEDAVFGFRAAGPALLANTSYYEKRICKWDPVGMAAV